MPDLTRLKQKLNYESKGGRTPGGDGALLEIINLADNIQLALLEQERWVNDGYGLTEEHAAQLADEMTQLILSTLISGDNFSEDYLIDQLCADDGYPVILAALERHRKRREEHALEITWSNHGHISVPCEEAHPGQDAPLLYDDHPF